MIGNLPNILTLSRILLLPFFAATIIYKEYNLALIIFIIAAVTDLFDGLIARLRNQITYFGSILDPVADKFFLITSFVLMSASGVIPKWLTIVVISKDVIVLTGCVILYFVTNSLKIEPTLLGKLASACQFVLIGAVLLFLNIRGEMQIPVPIYIAVALITGISGLHYSYKGLKLVQSENT
ncbi:MAG: CDP-alcohol phosphatidyltransferase family protein [Nitrospiraceae bacterium]|nr:MAG: CDP-alcohol phosphatidyltransferase family protein [Nitrospiraceae bacterium]